MDTTTKPNILWVCTDQQRYDTIRGLGNPEIHTPNLDKLVGLGVAFQRAYCQAPICTPSRATFLTGRYPASHHVERNGNEYFPPGEQLVTKLLAENGYECGLVGKLHLSGAQRSRERRNDDGYSYYCWSHHPYPDIEGNSYTDWLRNEKAVDPQQLFGSLNGAYGAGPETDLHQTTWCAEMAIQFIRERAKEPWLLSVNPFSPHPTFHPPLEFLNRYEPSTLSFPLFGPNDVERQKAFDRIDQQSVHATDPYTTVESQTDRTQEVSLDQQAMAPPSSYDARMLRACYYAEIELIDHQFGRIIEVLEETGQIDNTVIIFMSDHGELLGDHGLLYKGCRFFEGLVHVPLIISFPKRFQTNLRATALVELVDVAPTLMEIAGVEPPYYMQGKSLVPLLEGNASPDSHKQHVVCEYNEALPPTVDPHGEGSHATMYFDGRYKSVVYHGHQIGELYDLETDPGEFSNLWDDPSFDELKCKILKQHFDAIMATSDAGVRRTKEY